MILILDTSFLIYIVSRTIPSESLSSGFGGYDRVTMAEVIGELMRIAMRKNTTRGKNAGSALAYAKNLRIVGGEVGKKAKGQVADATILRYAGENSEVAIASLDRALLQQARSRGIRTITLSRGQLVGSPVL